MAAREGPSTVVLRYRRCPRTAYGRPVEKTDEQAVSRLIEALATRDRAGLAEVLDRQVRLRAALPSRFVDLTGAAEVAGEMLGWFEEVAEIAVVDTRVEPIGDIWHAGFRFALRGAEPEEVVEQHAFCAVADGSITVIRLACSGFRPAHVPAAPPAVARYIDALGDGCATLTPRIATALRELDAGEVLAVLTDDRSAPEGLASWSRLTGHAIVTTTDEGVGTRYYFRNN